MGWRAVMLHSTLSLLPWCSDGQLRFCLTGQLCWTQAWGVPVPVPGAEIQALGGGAEERPQRRGGDGGVGGHSLVGGGCSEGGR
jgi:hypothetical protein